VQLPNPLIKLLTDRLPLCFVKLPINHNKSARGWFFKKISSVIAQSELRHNFFTNCEKLILWVVMKLWLSYDWPKKFLRTGLWWRMYVVCKMVCSPR
jgi:hypothetical protein